MKKSLTRTLTLALAALMLLSLVVLTSCDGGGDQDKYVFKAGSVTLCIGDSADVIAQLGRPTAYNETASCGGIPGTDKLYVFAGYRVQSTPGNDGDVINKIEITDDSVKTPEGLTIGSTKDQVTKALGAGTASGENLTYKSGDTKLMFIIRDGYVTNIQYLKA